MGMRRSERDRPGVCMTVSDLCQMPMLVMSPCTLSGWSAPQSSAELWLCKGQAAETKNYQTYDTGSRML